MKDLIHKGLLHLSKKKRENWNIMITSVLIQPKCPTARSGFSFRFHIPIHNQTVLGAGSGILTDWANVLKNIHSSSLCARHSLIQFRVVHQAHLSKAKLSRIYPQLCPKIQRYHEAVCEALSSVLGTKIPLNPLFGGCGGGIGVGLLLFFNSTSLTRSSPTNSVMMD